MDKKILEEVKNLYGTPSGFSKDRRRAYYKLSKQPSEVNKDLTSIEEDVSTNFYVLGYEANTILLMDI